MKKPITDYKKLKGKKITAVFCLDEDDDGDTLVKFHDGSWTLLNLRREEVESFLEDVLDDDEDAQALRKLGILSKIDFAERERENKRRDIKNLKETRRDALASAEQCARKIKELENEL